MQFCWLQVLLFLVVLRHVSWWTLHWETGEESYGDFPGEAYQAIQSHQKSQWGEESPLLLPVSRQNPEQCGSLSLHSWRVCMWRKRAFSARFMTHASSCNAFFVKEHTVYVGRVVVLHYMCITVMIFHIMIFLHSDRWIRINIYYANTLLFHLL